MPLDDKRFYIHTTCDGALGGDTSTADVLALVSGLAPDKHIALHLHGGLVSRTTALDSAGKLLPHYQQAGVHPLFMVWESDFLPSVQNKLREVWQEGIFESLVKQLLRHTVGLLRPVGGARGRGTAAARPNDRLVGVEYQKLQQGQVPFATLGPPRDLPEVTPQEVQDFENDLLADPVFAPEAAEVARTLQAEAAVPVTVHPRTAAGPGRRTLITPEDVPGAASVADQPTGARPRGLWNVATLVYHAGKVLIRVISRFRQGRDHGVYATIVEEVLREFYFTNVGAALWGRMKRQTEYAFRQTNGNPQPGGLLLLQELDKRFPPGKPRPALSVVAHSAGAIYACHLLACLAERNAANPANDFRLKNLVLLAPACDFRLFALQIGAAAGFDNFRLFALSEGLESGYWEVPLLYPRSLLYLVSGAFEKEAGGDSAFDLPLLGMERYHVRTDIYQQEEVQEVRDFLAQNPTKSQVWSIASGGPGLDCDTKRHGDFFLDPDTLQLSRAMQSVCQVLQQGW